MLFRSNTGTIPTTGTRTRYLLRVQLYVKVFPEVGTAVKFVSTAGTVIYMPDAVQNRWQYTDRLPNSKMSGDCAKPPKSLCGVIMWSLCQTGILSGKCVQLLGECAGRNDAN